jgi:hypothetical protein
MIYTNVSPKLAQGCIRAGSIYHVKWCIVTVTASARKQAAFLQDGAKLMRIIICRLTNQTIRLRPSRSAWSKSIPSKRDVSRCKGHSFPSQERDTECNIVPRKLALSIEKAASTQASSYSLYSTGLSLVHVHVECMQCVKM